MIQGELKPEHYGVYADYLLRYIQSADAQGARAAFYQVKAESPPLYLDAGFRPIKLGEAARVRLAAFDVAEQRVRRLSGEQRDYLKSFSR